jgi:vacuolar protein sorting-associated protein VTA1
MLGQTDEHSAAGGIDPSTGSTNQGSADPSKPFITQFPSPPSNFTTAIPPTSPRQDALPPTNPGGFSTPASGANQTPTQPPSGGNQYWQQPGNTTNTSDANVRTNNPPSMPSPSLPTAPTFIPNAPRNTPPISNIPPPAAAPSATLGPTEVAQAQKLAKFAISALTYDDIKTARENLLKALDTIGYNQSNNFGFE